MAAPTAADVDALYGLAPSEFTAARKALVERLREAGRSDDARELAARRRPTAVLWAINQLARRHRDEVDAFLEAVERLRRAQSRGAEGLAEATAAERRARDALARRARDLLDGSGARATAATARSVANTLLGAAADRERAAQLRRGALEAELAAPGFEAWLGGGATELRVVGGREHRATGGRAGTAPARAARGPARSVRATAESRPPSAATSLAEARRARAAAEAREAIAHLREQLEERQGTLVEAEREASGAAEAADRLRAQAEEARATAQRLAREAAAAHAERLRTARRAAEAQRAVRDREQALERARRSAGGKGDE